MQKKMESLSPTRAEKRKIIIRILKTTIENHVSYISFDRMMYQVNRSLPNLWWWSIPKLQELLTELQSKKYDQAMLSKCQQEQNFQSGCRLRLNKLRKEELEASQTRIDI